MRKTASLIATSILIGAAAITAPGLAEARFGTGAIADAVAELSVAQPAQYRRSQRAYRRSTAPRTYTPPQSGTASPYRYPGSRGALDSCAFC
jgi:hypothetical protein